MSITELCCRVLCLVSLGSVDLVPQGPWRPGSPVLRRPRSPSQIPSQDPWKPWNSEKREPISQTKIRKTRFLNKNARNQETSKMSKANSLRNRGLQPAYRNTELPSTIDKVCVKTMCAQQLSQTVRNTQIAKQYPQDKRSKQ